MSELKPCPFCGGDAYTVYHTTDHTDYQEYLWWTVECHDCAAHTGLYAKKEFAIQAWNSRTKRTCEFEPFANEKHKEPGTRQGVCSECGASMHEQYAYCSNCGSKVVEL